MKDLSEHIEYLLLENNSIVLPQLGTLSVEHVPARYIEEENMFLPPSRNVSFVEDRSLCDDTLRICLENLHGISTQTAKGLVDDYINNINENLLTTGEFDLGTIGQFSIVANKITFYPCEAGISSQEFFALDTFQLRTLPSLSVKTRSYTENTEEEYYVIRISKKTVRNASRIAAMLVVIFMILFPGRQLNQRYEVTHRLEAGVESLYSNFITSMTSDVDNNKDILSKEKLSKKSDNKVLKKKALASNTTNTQKQVIVQKPIEATDEKDAVVDNDNYCIVLASATPVNMAEAYVKELEKEGIHGAYVCQKGKMVRVLLSGFQTQEEAIKMARELQDVHYIDAWTMKTPK